MTNPYRHPRYPEYCRAVPPTNWEKGAAEAARLHSWQEVWDRPTSKMNNTEYARPINFASWLYQQHPEDWFDYFYGVTDVPPDEKFIKHRYDVWKVYGGFRIHPSEIKRVYAALRMLAGAIEERSNQGGIHYRDVTLSDRGEQLHARTEAGKEILTKIWSILEENHHE